jgi:lysophospholipid acyltransferase (LPLAT)-like uncharacterized protein
MSLMTNLMSGYLALTYRTLRWTREGQEIAEGRLGQSLKAKSGAILALWHSRVPVGPTTWPQGADKPRSACWSASRATASSSPG